MAVQLIALDMDGTLLNSQHLVSHFSQETLLRATERGVALAFATGRSLCELDDLRHLLPYLHYAITENGASVRNLGTGEKIYTCGMDMQSVREIYRLLLPFDPMFELLADDHIYTQQSCLEHLSEYDVSGFEQIVRKTRTAIPNMADYLAGRTAPISKIHLFFHSPALRNQAIEATAGLPFDITHQLPANLEFNRKGVTKGVGVTKLAQALGIPLSDVMAIGDNFNDVPMLRIAGISVAMGNGESEARAAAKYITATNDQDGAAQAILRWVI